MCDWEPSQHGAECLAPGRFFKLVCGCAQNIGREFLKTTGFCNIKLSATHFSLKVMTFTSAKYFSFLPGLSLKPLLCLYILTKGTSKCQG